MRSIRFRGHWSRLQFLVSWSSLDFSGACTSDVCADDFSMFHGLFDQHLADQIASPNDFRVRDTVIDICTVAATSHQTLATQIAQMLRNVGLVEFGHFYKFVDPLLAIA